MEFTLTITGTVTPDLAPVLMGLTGGSQATTTASTKPATKQAKVEAPVAPAETAAATTSTQETGSTEKLTIEQIREVATEKADKNLAGVKALFKDFNVKRAVDLQPEQYAAFYAKVTAL